MNYLAAIYEECIKNAIRSGLLKSFVCWLFFEEFKAASSLLIPGELFNPKGNLEDFTDESFLSNPVSRKNWNKNYQKKEYCAASCREFYPKIIKGLSILPEKPDT